MISLRPAHATRADAAAFTALYRLATQGMMQRYLGPHAYALLERLFLLRGHEHSYEVTLFAEMNRQTVGLLMGYTTEAHAALSRRTLALYLRYGAFGLVQSLPSIARLRPLRAVTNSLPPQTSYIKGLAVDPAFRRRGIGRSLLAAAEAQAAQTQGRRLVLDVRHDNHAAIALYEACGYRTTAQTPVVRLAGEAFGFLRMEKNVG